MSGSANKVILIGHLGKDPEIRHTQDGKPIATLSLATGESWRDRATGERRDKTEWHRVVVFSEGLAKLCQQYLKKGARIYVEGKLSTREWEDQQGTKRYVTEVVLTGFNASLTMLDRQQNRPPDADSPDDYGRPGASTGSTSTRSAPDVSDIDDEIPF